MGETLNDAHDLDIEEEKRAAESRLNELQAKGAVNVVKLAMKDFGIERARKYGWPNTYVFTKALREMLLMEHKQHLPVVIIRPTIVTSTYKEPFPGWVEGIRTIDSVAVGYGKGRLAFLAGDPKTMLDVIPGDMVVNATLVAMVAHASQQGRTGIYHVGSSLRNPLYIADFQTISYRYFKKNPFIDKDGKPVIVGHFKLLRSMKSFNRYVYLHYLLPLQGFKLVNAAFCQYYEGRYSKLKRTINVVLRMFDIYKPYLFFKGVFDDRNTQKLWLQEREQIRAETDDFYFDPEGIIWEDYFLHTHYPGIVKYVVK